MLYLFVGIGALLIVPISLLAMRHLIPRVNQDWIDLAKQRETLRKKLRRTMVSLGPSQSHEPHCDHKSADAMWEALSVGNVDRGLQIAEEAMAADPANAQGRLLLAAALLAHEDYEAAQSQVHAAEGLGARGSMLGYLAGCIEIGRYVDSIAASSTGHEGNILVPVELLALDLHVRLGDGGDASALWIPEQGEVTQEQAREFVLVHFGTYYRILDELLDIIAKEQFGDGLFLFARLAIRCGFSEDGAEILMSLEESIVRSAHKNNYDLIMATLRGERPMVKGAKLDSGQRVVKLNVLN
ncbi:MAG: hypothetical protein GY811_04815 [Myxococcales bacterium]|nr:hypothetical protein [Myxococcales bacterium]